MGKGLIRYGLYQRAHRVVLIRSRSSDDYFFRLHFGEYSLFHRELGEREDYGPSENWTSLDHVGFSETGGSVAPRAWT